jgi:ubiquinone/menaquinone biosynthesis C-methylase UbiE
MDEIENLRLLEQKKYESIYIDQNNHYKINNDRRGYGRGNHGANMVSYVLNKQPHSVLDIGCGYGNFCDQIQKGGIIDVYGMDIASVKTGNVIDNKNIKFLTGEAHSLPFDDNSIDIITSFDVLEHCLEPDIDVIVKEIHRVVKNECIFSITYRQSGENMENGLVVHMTVKPESWWIDKLNNYFLVKKENKYLMCFKK